MNIFDNLLESYAKLKKRQLVFRVDEASAPISPEDPAVKLESDVIQQINNISPGKTQNVYGVSFTRNTQGENPEEGTKAKDNLVITPGTHDPRGGSSAQPVGKFEGGAFIPAGKPLLSSNTNSMWYKILNYMLKEGGAGETQEAVNPVDQVSITAQLDTLEIRRGIVSVGTSIENMYQNGLFKNILDRNPNWIGKTVAQPLSYIHSTGSKRGLNEKLAMSSAFVRERDVDPDTGEEISVLKPGLTVDPEVAGNCLGQLSYSLDTMSKYLNPETKSSVTRDELKKVSNLISIDRKVGLILRASASSDNFMCIPKGNSTFWDDIIDNFNIELENDGQYSSIIRSVSSRGTDSGNLNDIRGKSVERLLKVISLLKVNKEAAKVELLDLFSDYQEGLFEAFSILDTYNEGGILDEENLEKGLLAKDIKEILNLPDVSNKVPGLQGSLNQQEAMRQSKEAVIKILLGIHSLQKGTFLATNPRAVSHAGLDTGSGKKRDLVQVYSSKGEATKALKTLGIDPNSIEVKQARAGDVMSQQEIQDYGMSPDEKIYPIGVSVKFYLENTPMKSGESTERSLLKVISTESEFSRAIGENLNFTPNSFSSVKKINSEITKTLSTIDSLNDSNRGNLTLNTIVDTIKRSASHYGLTNNEILSVVEGTNGKETLDLNNPSSVSSCISRIRSYLFASIMDKKSSTKGGKEYIANLIANMACSEEEVLLSTSVLSTNSNKVTLNNEGIYAVLNDYLSGGTKLVRSSNGYSFRLVKNGKTLLRLKSDRKKSPASGSDGSTYTNFAGNYAVLVHHENLENLIKSSPKAKLSDEVLTNFLDSQKILFETLYNRRN